MILAFVGKGGVGKTTVASAVALSLSKEAKTVLVSSDFMPSLSYLFPEEQRGLDVMELRERDVSNQWKERYGDEVFTILNNIFKVDDWVLDHIAESPGVAEEFLISNIVDLELSGKYDYVVWDTAASSSTMHLILLQKEFYEHLSRDVKIYLRLRDVVHSDKILELLDQWKALAQRVWSQILKSKFYLVTTLDELSLVQSKEIASDLRSMGIITEGKICNRCGGDSDEGFLFRVPEIKGSAKEIVSSVTREISESERVIGLFRRATGNGAKRLDK